MSRPRSVLVVGGGLVAATVVRELRRLGFSGDLTVCGEEPHLPYDRPPLSKRFLTGATDRKQVMLPREAGDGTTWLTGQPVTDVRSGRALLHDGRSLTADVVVVATGAAPRWPSEFGTRPDRVHVLRSLDDAIGLQRSLIAGTRLAVLGGGFIGAEVAAAAVSLGLQVSLVEAAPLLFAGLGPLVGNRVERLHRDHEVTVTTGHPVTSVDAQNDAVVITLGDDRRIVADIALAGFGVIPRVSAATDLPLSPAGGIRCGLDGRVEGHDDIYAAGDVADWFDPVAGRHVHREHWTTAYDQAISVARTMMGAAPADTPLLPYFWSDQYAVKLQVVGRPEISEESSWISDPEIPDHTAIEYVREGKRVAVATWNAPRAMARLRSTVVNRPVEYQGAP